MTIGEKIKQARNRAGLTQIELANKINTHCQVIQQWEKGKRNPKYENLIKLARVLEIDISELTANLTEVKISAKDNSNLYLGCMAEYASTVVNGAVAIADKYNHDRLSAVKHLSALLKCLTEMDDFVEWGI